MPAVPFAHEAAFALRPGGFSTRRRGRLRYSRRSFGTPARDGAAPAGLSLRLRFFLVILPHHFSGLGIDQVRATANRADDAFAGFIVVLSRIRCGPGLHLQAGGRTIIGR